VPWPHCPNKSVFSNHLNWPYDTSHSFRLGSIPDLWFCGGKGPVSKAAARLTDNECLSVGRMQLSDMGVSDKRTVVGQVTWGIAGQGPMDGPTKIAHYK